VRKAEYIVACLLEAVPSGTTLRFGPGDDPYGEEFFSYEAALEGNREDEMLAKGHSFATQKNPGDIGVYSLKPQIGTMEKGTELIAQTFGIDPETNVNFSNKSGAPGKPIPLKDIFRERPMYKKSGEPEPEVDRKNPVKAAGVAHQPSDVPDKEMMQPDAEREKYVQSLQGQPTVQNIPLDFGMEVDSTWRQGGVLVSHVIPGGAAAQAGLQAGDRITKVEFETSKGYWGPYQVKTLDEFKRLRSFMEPGYNAGVKYIRGGHEYPAGIKLQKIEPTPVTAGSPQRPEQQRPDNPFQRAWVEMEKDKADLSSLTVGELAQYHRLTPKQVVSILDRMGARARDYIPHQQQPNERDPASVTGNQPANPSALT